MKILVTGANGYLGSGIVEAILDSGNEVVAKAGTDDSQVPATGADRKGAYTAGKHCG